MTVPPDRVDGPADPHPRPRSSRPAEVPADPHAGRREQVALLLAGALTPPERAAVEAHLRECAECRAELIELAGLPGLMSRLRTEPEPDPGLLVPSPAVRVALLNRVHAERSRARRRAQLRIAAAVAAAVLVVPAGLAVGAALSDDDPASSEPTPALAAMAPADPAGAALRGAAAATGRTWGSEVTVQVSGAADFSRLALVAYSRDGRREIAGWWAGSPEQITCSGATSFPRQDLARVVVQTADGRSLLTLDT